jgi:membrane associated rhomboid family serine protease
MRKRTKPRLTLTFIFISIIAFFFQPLPFFKYLAFVPAYAFSRPWSFVTSIFLHANFAHLFFNMFAHFDFVSYLEVRIRKDDFLILIFLAGIFVNFAYLLTNVNATIPAVGASGAIYGILGALAIIYPTLVVWVGYVPMPMIFAAIFWIILNFLGLFTPSNIAYQAHLAGIFVGIFYGHKIKKKGTYFKYY